MPRYRLRITSTQNVNQSHLLTPFLHLSPTAHVLLVEALISLDPCLPTQDCQLGYVDIFVDDFLTLAQGKLNRKRVRKILMQAIDQVIRPLQASDPATRREPISIKKLLQGDCSWGEMKIIFRLGN